jgi:hypothetical protein
VEGVGVEMGVLSTVVLVAAGSLHLLRVEAILHHRVVVDSSYLARAEVTLPLHAVAVTSYLAKFEVTLHYRVAAGNSYLAKVEEEVISQPRVVAGTTPLLKVVANTSPTVVVDNMMAVRLMYQRTDTVV